MKYFYKLYSRVIDENSRPAFIVKRGTFIKDNKKLIYYILSYDNGFLGLKYQNDITQIPS